jgi:hypothetical protein
MSLKLYPENFQAFLRNLKGPGTYSTLLTGVYFTIARESGDRFR